VRTKVTNFAILIGALFLVGVVLLVGVRNDDLVYRLYGLTEQEIQIVQGQARPDVTR